MTSDLHRPLAEVGGAVIRVDPAPALGMHGAGKEKIPLRAAHRFLAHLFPEGRPARIPTAAITGTAGKTTTSRMVARILQETGHAAGLACSDGVYVNGELVKAGVFSGISGALQVLTDPRVEAAVLEVSRGTLAQRGLGVDRTTVSACTKVEADHLGLEGIHTLADMARLKRVVVEQATELAVLNAEDPHCLAMRPHIRARRTCLVSTDPALKPLIAHANAGGLAVVLAAVSEAPRIELWEGDQREPLLRADEIPAAWGGAARHNIQNALFASAIALGMGATRETIRRALRGFASSLADSPGRINSYDKLPFRVIIDSAGTTPGYRALCDFVDRIPAEGHRVLVFHGMGDRRDQDLRASAQRVARSFDRFICFDTDLRGRRPGEVPELFRGVLFDEGVNPERVAVCLDRQEAILRAVGQAESGDLVVIASGNVRQLVSWLDDYVDSLRDD